MKTIKDQIDNLRLAIDIDEAEKIKAEAHADRFRSLQNTETKLKQRIERAQGQLKNVQAKIVEQMNITFDVSDDMTIEAAKETLAKLEAEEQNDPGI